MAKEILDPRKAFQPGSGYFGWMLIPDVQIVTGAGEMDGREKVIGAIEWYESSGDCVTKKEAELRAAQEARQTAEAELKRVLHAVYGSRAAKGVVLRGKKYAAVQVCTSGASQLEVTDAEFEVLG